MELGKPNQLFSWSIHEKYLPWSIHFMVKASAEKKKKSTNHIRDSFNGWNAEKRTTLLKQLNGSYYSNWFCL